MKEEFKFTDPKTIFGPLGIYEIPIIEEKWLPWEVAIFVRDMKKFKDTCIKGKASGQAGAVPGHMEFDSPLPPPSKESR